MKKIIALLLVLAMALTLVACGTEQKPAETKAPEADAPATEAAPETDADNLVPEPSIKKGCGAALAPAGMILLCFVGFAFGRKEDRDA